MSEEIKVVDKIIEKRLLLEESKVTDSEIEQEIETTNQSDICPVWILEGVVLI